MLFAVHDYETTGLLRHHLADLDKQPRAIEFGGIITDGENIISKLEFICNPGRQIEQIITDITGLTNEDLVTKESWEFYLPQLKDYFGQADCVISHNLSFDRGISKVELAHLKLGLPDMNWPKLELCTVEQTMEMYGRRMRLTELYNMHCGTYVQKHRALDDVMLLHELCQKLGIYKMFIECHAAEYSSNEQAEKGVQS